MPEFGSDVGYNPTPDVSSPKKKKGGLTALIAIVVIILIGGFLLYRSSQSKKQEAKKIVIATPSPTKEVTPTQEATPSPELSPTKAKTSAKVTSAKDLSIEVLNGSGEEGVASKVRDFLANKGYKNLDVGNADNFNYQDITVRIKEDKKQFLSELENDLKSSYTISTNSGTILSASSAVDASVIVGKQQ